MTNSQVNIQPKAVSGNIPDTIDVLKAIYDAYKAQPGDKTNSELIRNKLGLSVERMNDFILKLRERGFITATYVGERSLLAITADGITILTG